MHEKKLKDERCNNATMSVWNGHDTLENISAPCLPVSSGGLGVNNNARDYGSNEHDEGCLDLPTRSGY